MSTYVRINKCVFDAIIESIIEADKRLHLLDYDVAKYIYCADDYVQYENDKEDEEVDGNL